jgi:thiol-disulfide isomerase/thioredoxin
MLIRTITLIITFFLGSYIETSADEKNKLNKNSVTFKVTLDSSIKFKPYLMLYENSFHQTSLQTERKDITPVAIGGNSYLFLLKNQLKPMYFSLVYKKGTEIVFLLDSYRFEPGDQINICMDKTPGTGVLKFVFGGETAGKYKCHYELSSVTKSFVKNINADALVNLTPYDIAKLVIKAQLALVDHYKSSLSQPTSDLMKADIKAKALFPLLTNWLSHYRTALKDKDALSQKRLLKEYLDCNKFNLIDGSSAILFQSRYYTKFIMAKVKIDYLVDNHEFNYSGYFNKIKEMPEKLIRDKMMVSFFYLDDNKGGEIFGNLLKEALLTVENDECRNKLSEFKKVSVGNKAFNFSLQDEVGKLVKLSDFKGKIVFIDFWFTGCGACKSYYSEVLSKVERNYEHNAEVKFITICVDLDKKKWLASLKSGMYTSEKALNLFTNGEGNKHEIVRFYNINGYPKPMIIDRNGNILNFKGNLLREAQGLTGEIEKAMKL